MLRRSDGLYAYQLAVVVDDARMAISDVVRGNDLLSSTPRQLFLFERLGKSAPRFWHIPLVVASGGERLAKRQGSLSVRALRERGVDAEDLVGQLCFGLGLLLEPEALSVPDVLRRLGHRLGPLTTQSFVVPAEWQA